MLVMTLVLMCSDQDKRFHSCGCLDLSSCYFSGYPCLPCKIIVLDKVDSLTEDTQVFISFFITKFAVLTNKVI
jgi:hypothetical protein